MKNQSKFDEIVNNLEKLSYNGRIKGIIDYGMKLNNNDERIDLIKYLLDDNDINNDDSSSQRIIQIDIKSTKKNKDNIDIIEDAVIVNNNNDMDIDINSIGGETLVDVLPPSKGGLAKIYSKFQMGLMLAANTNNINFIVDHVKSSSHMLKNLCISFLTKTLLSSPSSLSLLSSSLSSSSSSSSSSEITNINLLKSIIEQSPSSVKNDFIWACTRELNGYNIIDDYIDQLISNATYQDDNHAAMLLHGSSDLCVKKYLKRFFLGIDHPDVKSKISDIEKEKLGLRSKSIKSLKSSEYIRWPLIWKNHSEVILEMIRQDLEKCDKSNDPLDRAFEWSKWNPAIKFNCKIHHSHPKSINSYDNNSNVPWEELIRLYFEFIPYYPSSLALRTRNYSEFRDLSETGIFKITGNIKIFIDSNDNGIRNSISKVERRLIMFSSSIVSYDWVYTILRSYRYLSLDTILSLTKIIGLDMSISLSPYGKCPARFVDDSENLFTFLFDGILSHIESQKNNGKYSKSTFEKIMEIVKAYISELSPVIFYAAIDNETKIEKLSLEAKSCLSAFKTINNFLKTTLKYLDSSRILQVLNILKDIEQRMRPSYELFKMSDECLLIPKSSSYYEIIDEDNEVFGEDIDQIPPTSVTLSPYIIGSKKYLSICKIFYDWTYEYYNSSLLLIKNRLISIIQSRKYGKANNSRQLTKNALEKTYKSEKILESIGSIILNDYILRIRTDIKKCIDDSSSIFGLDPIKSFQSLNIDNDALNHDPNILYPFNCFDEYSLNIREKLFFQVGDEKFFKPPGSLKANRFQSMKNWITNAFNNNISRNISFGIWQKNSTFEFLEKVYLLSKEAIKNDPKTLSLSTQKKNKLIQEYNGASELLYSLEKLLESLLKQVSQLWTQTEIYKIDREFTSNIFTEKDDFLINETFPIPQTPVKNESILKVFDLYIKCSFRHYNLLDLNQQLPSIPIKDDYIVSYIEKALQASLYLPYDLMPKRVEELAFLYGKHIISISNSKAGNDVIKFNARTANIAGSLTTLKNLVSKELWFKLANTFLDDQDLPMTATDFLIPYSDIKNKSLRRRFEKKVNRKDDESRIKYLMDYYDATLESYSCIEYENTLRFMAERIKNEKFENQKQIISKMFSSSKIQSYILKILLPHSDTSIEQDLRMARISLFLSKEYGVSSEDDILRCSTTIPQLILQIFEDHINLPDAPFSSSSTEKLNNEEYILSSSSSSSRKKTYSSIDLEGINAIINLAQSIHLRCLFWRPVPQSQGKTYLIQTTYFNLGFEIQYRWYKHEAPEIDSSGWSSIPDWVLSITKPQSRIPNYDTTKLPIDKNVIDFETRCVTLLFDAYQSKSLLDFDINKINEKARQQITSFSGVMARIKNLLKIAPTSWDKQEKITNIIDKLFKCLVDDWSLLNPLYTSSSQPKKKRKSGGNSNTNSTGNDNNNNNNDIIQIDENLLLDDQSLEYWSAIDSLAKQENSEQINRHQRFSSFHLFFSSEIQAHANELSSLRSILLESNTPKSSNYSSAIEYSKNRSKKNIKLSLSKPIPSRSGRGGRIKAPRSKPAFSSSGNATNYSNNLIQAFATAKALPITVKYLDWIVENFGLHHPALDKQASSRLLCSWIRLKLGYYGISGESRRIVSFMQPRSGKLERHPIKRDVVFKLLSNSKSAIHLKIVQSYLIRFHQDKLEEFFNPENRSSSTFLGKFSMIRPEVADNQNGGKSLIIPGSANFRFPGYYGFHRVIPSIAYSLAVQILDDVCNSSLSLQLRTEAIKRFSILPCISFIDLLELYSKHMSLHNAEEEQKRIDEIERQQKAQSLINDFSIIQTSKQSKKLNDDNDDNNNDDKDDEEEDEDDNDKDDDNNNDKDDIDMEDDDDNNNNNDDDDIDKDDIDNEKLPKTISEVIETKLTQSLPVAVAETLLRGIMIGDDPLGPVSFLLSSNMIALNTARETIKVVQHATHYLDPSHIIRLIRALFSQSARGNNGNRMPVGVHKMLCNMLLSLTNDKTISSEAQELLVIEWSRGKNGPGAMHRDIQITILVGALRAISEGSPQEWAWKILSSITNEFDRTVGVMIVLLVADPTILVRSYKAKIYVDTSRLEMYLDKIVGVLNMSKDQLKAPLDELIKSIEPIGSITIHQNHHEKYKLLLLKTYNSLLVYIPELKELLEKARKELDIAFAENSKISTNNEPTKEEKAIRVNYSKAKVRFDNCKEKLNSFTDFSALVLISLIRWCGRDGSKTDEDIFIVLQNELFSIDDDHIHPNYNSDSKARIQLYLDIIPKHLSLLASDWYLKAYTPSKALGIKEIIKRFF